MSDLCQRARKSGTCPLSLLNEECSLYDIMDGFQILVFKLIDDNGTVTYSRVAAAAPSFHRPC
jgi:hypothetical protein